MADRLPLPNSGNDLKTFDAPEKFNLPTPSEPLREWTEQSIDPTAMIAEMEAVMRVARWHPNFEADRLARKTMARFTYIDSAEVSLAPEP
jgi:hypothetical protein